MADRVFQQIGSVISTKIDTVKTELLQNINTVQQNLTTFASGHIITDNNYTNAEKNKLTNIENGANNYALPIAAPTVLGGVKVGSGLSIDGEGVLSALGAVTSVAGKTGAVTLTATDVSGISTVGKTGDYNDLTNKPTAMATAYDVLIFVPETMLDSEVVHSFLVPRQFTLNTSGHVAKATAASLVNCTFYIKKDNTTVGTVYFASGSVNGTVTINAAPANTFAIGTKFQIVAPTPADVSLADVYISLLGTLG